METQIVSEVSAFHSLRDEWNELAASRRSPLLRHEWFASSAEYSPLTTITIRSGKRLRAAAPMMATRHLGVPQLRVLGYDLGEPCGLLYDSEESLAALLESIHKFHYPFTLTKFDTTTPEITTLKLLLPKLSVCIDFNPCTSLWVALKSRWEGFEASISSRRRSDLRRYQRRAERYGEVEFEAFSPDVGTLAPLLEELFRLEASGWKGRSGTDILSSPKKTHFYEHYARASAEAGVLRMFRMRVGGQTAVMRMAVVHYNRLWDMRIGYNEHLSDCAPGVLLTHETMRYACGQGLEAYEFLGMAEAWERLWPCQEHHYVSVKVYPPSITSGFSVLLDGCRVAARKTSGIVQ